MVGAELKYIQVLTSLSSRLRGSRNNIPVATSTPNARISENNNWRYLGKWIWGLGKEIYKMGLEHLAVSKIDTPPHPFLKK